MFKLIILTLLFMVCSYAGFAYGESFKRRNVQLREIEKSIILLQNEVLCNNTPLPEALSTLESKCKEPLNKLFAEVADILIRGEKDSTFEAFKSIYKKQNDEYYLKKEDENVLEDFLRSLGESGIYAQEKLFNLAISNLKINIKESADLAKKNTKLYRYLGVLVGAMITIFLL